MSNYYQEKKNYNKYNPNSSFSDMDCYGNDYFGNNNSNKTNYSNNPYSNSDSDKFSQKPINNNIKFNNKFNSKTSYNSKPYSNSFSSNKNIRNINNDDSSDSRTTLFEKNSPLSVFFIFYLIIIMLSGCLINNIWENVVSGSAVGRALFYTLLESPILYIVLWKLIIENISKSVLTLGGDRFIASIMSAIAIPIIATIINCGIIHTCNKSFDKSPTIVRYLSVNNKRVISHRNSKSRRTTYTYHVYFTSWVDKKDFSIKVPQWNYDQFEVGDIIKVNTRAGYYGYQYYDNISSNNKVDKKQFPDYAVFPLTEEEAEKYIEYAKKKREEEEEKRIMNKYKDL